MENIVWLCPFSVAEWKSFGKITSSAFSSKTNLICSGPRVELIRGAQMNEFFILINPAYKMNLFYLQKWQNGVVWSCVLIRSKCLQDYWKSRAKSASLLRCWSSTPLILSRPMSDSKFTTSTRHPASSAKPTCWNLFKSQTWWPNTKMEDSEHWHLKVSLRGDRTSAAWFWTWCRCSRSRTWWSCTTTIPCKVAG